MFSVRKGAIGTSSIAYAMSVGQLPGVISSPGSIVGGNVGSIASPAAPDVPSPKTAVTSAQQNQNTDASITQLPPSDQNKAIAGFVGLFAVIALVGIFLAPNRR